MKQQITLNSDGVVVPGMRMKLHQPSNLKNPSTRLNRLQQLLRTGKPHICLIRGEGIGDVLMMTPTIHAIRQMFQSNATITVATNTNYLEGALVSVLKHNPDIDYIIERNLLKDEDYDCVINLHCPCVKYEIFGAKPPNRIDIFAKHAGVELRNHKPLYYPTPSELEWAKQFFDTKRPGTKTIFVQLFASSKNRSIDNRHIRDAITILHKMYGVETILLSNKSDPSTDIEWSVVPGISRQELSIREIGSVIPYCDLVLCPDSSILHLAGALSVPTVSLFTTTYPPSRINHYPQASAVWDEYPPCPCVVSDSLITTSNGYKEIQYLEPGEIVKTEDGCWNTITKVHRNLRNNRKLYDVNYLGSNEPITITEDHKMLVLKNWDKDIKNVNKEWIPAKELTNKDYLCIPRNKPCKSNTVEPDIETCWIMGLYAAEGHLRPDRKSVVFTTGFHEEKIINRIKEYGKKHNKTVGVYSVKTDNSIRIELYDNSLVNEILLQFGRNKAKRKTIPPFLWSATIPVVNAFLSGYMDGDGYTPEAGENVLSTASKEMAYGIQELYTQQGILAKIYKRIRDTNYKLNSTIYRVCIPKQYRNNCKWTFDDNYIYTPVKSTNISDRTDDYVYDITVKNNTTFCIQNLATWDCWYDASTCPIRRACTANINGQRIADACIEALNTRPKVDILHLLENTSAIKIDTIIV